ncbi:MAG: inositol phosphorylceramide synthase [Deltaproteobacteria bacterium]|nr:inositol phosphorylceramide synthase [Deltaproteobacteria bacterium]
MASREQTVIAGGKPLSFPRSGFLRLAACLMAYSSVSAAGHLLTPIHVFISVSVLALFLLERCRQAIVLFLPFLAYVLFYDFFRLVPFSFLTPIHVTDVYLAELTLFGVRSAEGLIPISTYLKDYISLPFSCVAAVFYSVFLPAVPITALVLWKRASSRVAERFLAAFFIMNMLAFMTEMFMPVAPPWYVTKCGFGAPLVPILGDPARLIEVERFLGTHFYTSSYQMSAIVFGAFPSMHAGITALVFFYVATLKKKGLTILAGLYLLGMCFSAVYLEHHYVVDLMAGILYALTVFLLMEVVFPRQIQRSYKALRAFFLADGR